MRSVILSILVPACALLLPKIALSSEVSRAERYGDPSKPFLNNDSLVLWEKRAAEGVSTEGTLLRPHKRTVDEAGLLEEQDTRRTTENISKSWQWPQLPLQPDGSTPDPLKWGKPCPEGCNMHGTCDRFTGTCRCPPDRTGSACSQFELPACRIQRLIKESEVINREYQHTLKRVVALDKECDAPVANSTIKCSISKAGEDDGGFYGALYQTPCDRFSPKTCTCLTQCSDANVGFGKSCVASVEEVFASLEMCEKSCNFHGWCGKLPQSGQEVVRKCHCFPGWSGRTCDTPDDSYCLGGCSGKGRCDRGFCHCDPGFFGEDCALFMASDEGTPSRLLYRDAAQTQQHLAAAQHSEWPEPVKVYVYELPGEFNSGLYYHGAVPLELRSKRAQRIPDSVATVHPAVQDPAAHPELFLHERFLSSAHRTLDPEEADFFFVPVWRTMAKYIDYNETRGVGQGQKSIYSRVIAHINASYPFWARHGGRDHMFVVTAGLGACDKDVGSGPAGTRPPELQNAILLSHWGGVHYKKKRSWKGRCFLPGQDIVIPPLPRIHLHYSPYFARRPHQANRTVLLFFAGSVWGLKDDHTVAKPDPNLLRRARREVFLNQGAGFKFVVGRAKNYHSWLRKSIFCLAPSSTRPAWGVRLVQAIVHGCIPVITQDGVKQPFEGFLPYRNFALRALPSPAAQSTQEVLMQQILAMQKQQGEMLEMQRQQAEEDRLLRDELQRQSQINVALEAKQSVNPFPPRPATLTTRMPQLYDLHGNKTYDALSKKSNSSMKYECLVLAPALSYLHDVVYECNETLDADEDCELSNHDWQKRFHAVTNSVHGVYAMLCYRWTMLELRGQVEQVPGSSQHGGSDALRAKLQFVEDRVYQAADGVVADEVLQQWLNDFDKNRGKAMLNFTSKSAANSDARVVKDHRDQRWKERKKYDEEKDGKKPTGKGGKGRSEVMQWITHGVKLRWKRGPPPPFDHGVSLRVARRQQQWSVKNRVKMETLKKLRRLAKPGDWCFSFDLQDGFHALGIHPDFQRFMQFNLQGDPFHCYAVTFGWNDAPRVFCKFVRVMVEALHSPQAAKDRREIRKLRDGSAVRQRWSVRHRAGGAGEDAKRHSGMRVLPYMDDFLVLVDSQREGFLCREKVQLVLHRLGLRRNEKKGQWEPAQVVEHLGLEVDLKLGQFLVTERRVHKIHTRAKEILCDTARNQRWIPARRLPSFMGLYQSVYLAVPAARLFLRELYFVLAEKRSWGTKVKISRAARGDLEWWSKLPGMSRWNGRKIWRSPTRAKVHTDSSMMAWGGVLNLKFPARGFWPDEMRNWHITHLELEAVYKTVQAFLKELEGKVARLYCDNQAVVAMLSHFTSRNPDLMRRMRRLWLLLDLHDIELQARYIRSEANVWANNLSRCEDLDDWRLNREWFVWASEQWGPFTVDRFASEISAQLPWYYAAWKDPKCEGVDSLTYDWRGENNWVNPPWALLDEVAHKLREEGAVATVVAPYWPGQFWFRELEALATEVALNMGRCDVLHRGVPMSYYAVEVRRNCTAKCTTAGEVTVGSKIEMFWKGDDCFYPGVVKEFNEDGKAHVLYDDGDEETLDLSEEDFKIIDSSGVSELTDEAAGRGRREH
ncbi:hypothetical protein CYMTET_48882 [Cymbomonas tetramitiformis]|uniref:EGF-like domain-containing protein n=1 Tax=Cymbomonas tetramitiformis TaxID=36881 RepID=A0AAE0EUP3_9CHLO|nr:hypothetical protein CYMTET_48882 [Cymbomonas tetramitiformis]